MPYEEGDLPFHDYSTRRPLQPPPPAAPGQTPARRPRRAGLLLGLAVVGVVLVIALSSNLQALFRQSAPASTPVAAQPALTPLARAQPNASFQTASCPFQTGDGMLEGRTLRCGYVTVPENRSDPAGAKVKLAVAIFKSPTSVQQDFNPVLRLDGGPGGPSLDDWAHYITSGNESSFVFNHDLIMFDQRGTGYSTPSLKCPETLQLQFKTLDEHLSAAASNQLQLQALRACHDRLLRAGVDLNAFNSLENAADVHDLVLALGYRQVNLYGVSYGTRLALTVMRLYPQVIRSVVLDSVYPPQKNRNDLPAGAQRSFDVLFRGCAADVNCNTLYPRLDSVFYQLVTDLNASPAHFQSSDATSGKSYKVVMAGDDFVFLLFSALYVTQFIPALPQMIYQIRQHNYRLLSQVYGAVEFDDTFSDGMFYSAECSEDWDYLTPHDIATALQGIAPQIQPALRGDLQSEYASCRLWNVQKAPAAQKEAVVSSIATLVLSDEYDPITPPANGRLAARTLTHSYYLLLPGLGHGAEYNSACVDAMISTFDDNPAQRPASGCVAGMGEPKFV